MQSGRLQMILNIVWSSAGMLEHGSNRISISALLYPASKRFTVQCCPLLLPGERLGNALFVAGGSDGTLSKRDCFVGGWPENVQRSRTADQLLHRAERNPRLPEFRFGNALCA